MTARIRAIQRHRPRGDVGPCVYEGCEARATWILQLNAAGYDVIAWVCDDHALEVNEPVEVQP